MNEKTTRNTLKSTFGIIVDYRYVHLDNEIGYGTHIQNKTPIIIAIVNNQVVVFEQELTLGQEFKVGDFVICQYYDKDITIANLNANKNIPQEIKNLLISEVKILKEKGFEFAIKFNNEEQNNNEKKQEIYTSSHSLLLNGEEIQ